VQNLNWRDPTVEAALIAALASIIVWAITQTYSTRHDANVRRLVARLERLNAQMEELYGPLLGIIRQTFVVYDVASRILPTKDGQIDQNGFQGKDIDAWRFLQEQFFFPLNDEAVALLKTKTHLIGADVPDSFEQFLLHATQFECLFRLWKTTGFDSSGKVEGIGWPATFEADVRHRFDRIRAEHTSIIEGLKP
jgi:hypothetical protein